MNLSLNSSWRALSLRQRTPRMRCIAYGLIVLLALASLLPAARVTTLVYGADPTFDFPTILPNSGAVGTFSLAVVSATNVAWDAQQAREVNLGGP